MYSIRARGCAYVSNPRGAAPPSHGNSIGSPASDRGLIKIRDSPDECEPPNFILGFSTPVCPPGSKRSPSRLQLVPALAAALSAGGKRNNNALNGSWLLAERVVVPSEFFGDDSDAIARIGRGYLNYYSWMETKLHLCIPIKRRNSLNED